MRLPIIKVQDNCDKRQFVVSDANTHNYLYADNKGIHYYNLQNGEGTGGFEDSGYSFVGEAGYMGVDIPMVDIIDILLLYSKEMVRPLNDPGLDLEFDLMAGAFKVLDLRVEYAREEQRKEFMNKMRTYVENDESEDLECDECLCPDCKSDCENAGQKLGTCSHCEDSVMYDCGKYVGQIGDLIEKGGI